MDAHQHHHEPVHSEIEEHYGVHADPRSTFMPNPLQEYVPVYPTVRLSGIAKRRNLDGVITASTAHLESAVPWELRSIHPHHTCSALRFITTRQFWQNVEDAVRVAIVGMLPSAVLLNTTYGDGNGPWVSQSSILLGALLAIMNKETVGQQIMYMGQFVRSSLVWVPAVTAANAVSIYDYTPAWFVWYAGCLILMASLMDGYCRRLAMLLFTIATMDMLRLTPDTNIRPLRLCLEWLLGACFGFVGVLLPWPSLSSRRADDGVVLLSRNLSTVLQGLCNSFWADSNLTRNVRLVRIRYLLNQIESMISLTKKHMDAGAHEWMLQSSERRVLRGLKVELYIELYRNMMSIRRVVEIVRDKPATLSHSERAVMFGQRLGKRIDAICSCVDDLLFHIGRCQNHQDMLDIAHIFSAVSKHHDDLQAEFHASRREFFYETQLNQLEEFVPLMTFYVFCIAQICVTIGRFRESARREFQERTRLSRTQRFIKAVCYSIDYFLISPVIQSTISSVHNICFRRSAEDIRAVIEAFKVSGAMVASIAFYFYTDRNTAFLSGPTVIAFIASANPAEAINSSITRLTGTLMGVVLGFFIANNSEDAVARVAGVLTLVFVGRLVGTVKNIGAALLYAGFISISQVSIIPLTQSQTMSRIQQTTFAVFIYVLVTLFVFPCRPTALLRKARSEALLRISRVYCSLIAIFADSSTVYAAMTRELLEGNCMEPYAHESDAVRSVTDSFTSHMYPAYPTDQFADIDQQLREVDKYLLNAQALMPFAVDEPRLSSVPYPSSACSDTQSALKKSVALLRTLAQSMRLLRERHQPPSHIVIELLTQLSPCAKDTAVELTRFSMLMSSLILDRRLDLGTEVAKSSQLFAQMSSELHVRKSRLFLLQIRHAVDSAVSSPSGPPSRGLAHPRTASAPDIINHFPPADTPVCESRQHASTDDVLDGTTVLIDLNPGSATMRTVGLGTEVELPVVDDDGIMRPRMRSLIGQRINLPSTYQIPVTTQDAESLHTITFCVVLLSAELKKLLVVVEDSLQHHEK